MYVYHLLLSSVTFLEKPIPIHPHSFCFRTSFCTKTTLLSSPLIVFIVVVGSNYVVFFFIPKI